VTATTTNTDPVVMMTRDDIWRELRWTSVMVRRLLGGPDGQETRYRDYTYYLYLRERVMAVARQPAAIELAREYESYTECPSIPPGYTDPLRPVAAQLKVSAVAVGKALDRFRLRMDGIPTDLARSLGLALRRFDGELYIYHWHIERFNTSWHRPSRPRIRTRSND
jgi:hypothetical protein